MIRCTDCRRVYDADTDILCVCGAKVTAPLDDDGTQRQAVCKACPHLDHNQCKWYLRRCSTHKLWQGRLAAPDQCPQRLYFEEMRDD